ncbi:hypothetical protein H072_10241 [Dactylellina haptotyla CBS 200.50]|uniref:Uncharacterized protein n=1 Tax=Dactylellina haptotyla (strain CBS 200.50) TaxID=1284197 RepID=S8BAI1_DACHA|nr:hypothetical protein H072_10241 [Dactylellina haptotyla CBS 200.50]
MSNPSIDLSYSQTSAASSYLGASALSSSDNNDVESIGSESTERDVDSDAELEWQESMKQLEMLLTMVLIPFAGKWLGRRCAFWAWAKAMEWKYPVDVVITSKAEYRVGGIAAVASVSPPI